MRKQVKGVLSSLIADMKAGLTTRRMLLKQAVRMGLASSTLMFLESCGSTSPPCSPTKLTWWSERDDIGTYQALVNLYNRTNECGIFVVYKNAFNSDSLHGQLTQGLQRRNPDPDIISMDVVWTDEFASEGWVVPLDFWSAEEQRFYLNPSIQSSTYQEKIYAAPFRTDIGLMYYRTDLDFGLNLPDTIPQTWTWDDLERMVQNAKSHNGPNLPQYGYLWQATNQQIINHQTVNQYEGLVCNFVEVLSSYGGSILDPHDPEHVTISRPAAKAALQKMRSWLSPGSISPFNFTTSVYDEGSTAGIWENGNAMFMRNWPTYISDSNKDTHPKVQGKFDITTLPGGHKGLFGRSCIGGWGLAINAFSSQEKRDAAWNFIHWMLQEKTQIFAAIDASFTMTHANIYNNKYLNMRNPFYNKISDIIIHHSQVRPHLPNYQPFSLAIQEQIYQILTDPSPNLDIDGSLKALQKKLQDIIDKGKKSYK